MCHKLKHKHACEFFPQEVWECFTDRGDTSREQITHEANADFLMAKEFCSLSTLL